MKLNLISMLPFEQNEVNILEDIVETDVYHLIVFNDDVNTFEYVIDTLMEVCEHAPHQAEQCTLIIHHKGKCSVKDGSWDQLVPMRNEICRRGLSAEVLN